MKIEVTDVRVINGDGAVKAFVDVQFAGAFLLKGFSVVQAVKKNLFVAMPRKASKDGRWFETFTVTDEALKVELETAIMEAYENALEVEEAK